jgi:5'-nucleotidase
MRRTFRPLALALALAASFPATAAVVAGCEGEVIFGDQASSVANRPVGDLCLADYFNAAENVWPSHTRFVEHAVEVIGQLGDAGALAADEPRKLHRAAARSNVGRTLKVKLIAFNDFHGNLEAAGSNPGVARFATRIQQLKDANPLHAVVSAGDLIGASPLVSALFHDEPTIEAMNRIGIDFNAVGNHEFDDGRAELLRMQRGGNFADDANTGLGLPADLEDGHFAGADFDFLAANVVDSETGKTLLPAYGVKRFLGKPVAFIGMTLENTPSIVSPAGVAGLEFRDEADTVNALLPELRRRNVEAVVVLIHEGGFAAGGINGCDGVSGPIVDIVSRLDPEVDLVVTGHTHQAYNCLLPNAAGLPVRVTSGGQFARNLTEIDLTLDSTSREVVKVDAVNLVTGTGDATAEAPALAELVQHYQALAAGPKNRVIGQIAATVTRTANAAGESLMGDLIADGQLDATDDAGFGDAVVAFMNPGGIRADLPYAAIGKLDGDVTYGEAFTVQPFGNSLVTMTLTGAQLETLLEQQFTGCPNNQPFNRILQVSRGFSYVWDAAGPACDKVAPASIRLNGVVVDPAASYRVTVNSFLADGGDLFSVLKAGGERLGGAQDLDALEDYFTGFGVVDPAAYLQGRILRLN